MSAVLQSFLLPCGLHGGHGIATKAIRFDKFVSGSYGVGRWLGSFRTVVVSDQMASLVM